MSLSETGLTKEKVNLLGLVRPLQNIFIDSKACHKYLWSLGDIPHNVLGHRDSPLAQ